MENLQECAVCAASIISEERTLTKPTLKNNLSVYFLVKKVFDISDSTFVHLLKCWGDPFNWISCCQKCSKAVLEAQKLFVEIKKLEGQLTQLKNTIKENVYQCTQNPRKFSRERTSNIKAVQMIREETVKRLKLSSSVEQSHQNDFEVKIKMEIEDDISGNDSDEVEDSLIFHDNDEIEVSYNKDTVKYEPISKPQKKSKSRRLCKKSIKSRNYKSSSFEIDKVETNVRRSRSGRIIKSIKTEYNSDSSESPDVFPHEKQENSSDGDYSPPTSPVTQGDIKADKLSEDKDACLMKNNNAGPKLKKLKLKTKNKLPKKKYTFQCTECPKYYFRRHSLWRHNKLVHCLKRMNGDDADGDQTLDEKVTPAEITQGDIKADKLSEDEHPNIFQCTECPKNYSSQYNLNRHIKDSHSLRRMNGDEDNGGRTLDETVTPAKIIYECERCGEKFSRSHHLRKHKASAHKGSPQLKILRCELCPRKFSSQHRLDLHIPTHEKDRFKCSECGKTQRSNARLIHHVETVHQKKKKFICEICSASFSLKEYLKCHQMKKHNIGLELGKKTVEHKCDECEKVFGWRSSLREHVNKIHLKIIKFRCPICNIGRHSSYELKKHLRSAHTDDRPEVCEVCQKSFKSKTLLKYHMRGHTGEKPHQCKFCSKGFTNNTAKRRHEESIHSSLKPYQCELCGKSYPSNDYLISHRWYSHNNKQSTLPPKNIIPTEEVEKIVREEILKEKPPVPDLVVGDKDMDNSLEGGGSRITNIIP